MLSIHVIHRLLKCQEIECLVNAEPSCCEPEADQEVKEALLEQYSCQVLLLGLLAFLHLDVFKSY